MSKRTKTTARKLLSAPTAESLGYVEAAVDPVTGNRYFKQLGESPISVRGVERVRLGDQVWHVRRCAFYGGLEGFLYGPIRVENLEQDLEAVLPGDLAELWP